MYHSLSVSVPDFARIHRDHRHPGIVDPSEHPNRSKSVGPSPIRLQHPCKSTPASAHVLPLLIPRPARHPAGSRSTLSCRDPDVCVPGLLPRQRSQEGDSGAFAVGGTSQYQYRRKGSLSVSTASFFRFASIRCITRSALSHPCLVKRQQICCRSIGLPHPLTGSSLMIRVPR